MAGQRRQPWLKYKASPHPVEIEQWFQKEGWGFLGNPPGVTSGESSESSRKKLCFHCITDSWWNSSMMASWYIPKDTLEEEAEAGTYIGEKGRVWFLCSTEHAGGQSGKCDFGLREKHQGKTNSWWKKHGWQKKSPFASAHKIKIWLIILIFKLLLKLLPYLIPYIYLVVNLVKRKEAEKYKYSKTMLDCLSW